MDAAEHSSPPKHFLLAAPSAREAVLLGAALALLSCLPFLVATYPQMSDYPSHLARYHVMLDGGRSAWLARYYGFEWRWSGNLGVDLLIWPMAKLFGLELGSKIIAATIPPLLGFAMMAVEWALRRRIGIGSMLAFVTIWSPALLLGMTNFSLALAMALFAFALWVKLDGWRWRGLFFVPISIAVWLCHLAGWGVLGLLVFGYEWQKRRGLSAFLAPLPMALPVIPVVLGSGTAGFLSYGKNVGIYKLSIWFMAMSDNIQSLDIYTLALLLVAFGAAAIFRKLDPRLGWTALVFIALSLIIPRHLGGGDYSDYRLIAVSLMTACLAISWHAPRLVLWLAPSLFVVRLIVTTSVWQAGSRDTAVMLQALDHLPVGARVASAVPQGKHEWGINLFQHVASYATVRRDALVNTHFAEPGVHMLTVRDGGLRFQDPSQRILHSPGKIDLAQFKPSAQVDYLWFIGPPKPDTMPPGAVIIWRSQHSFLARLAKAPPAR